MASFLDYYNQAAAGRGTGRRVPTGEVTKLNFDTGSQDEGAKNPITWLLSALQSGKYAVTNVPNQILNEEKKRVEARRTGTQYDELGGAINVLTSPFRGLFAGLTNTSDADRIDVAPLIEKTADITNMTNPNYTDVPNNVEAPVAGFWGFTGDVLLDPTTYFGGAIAKGVAKGLDMAGTAIKGGAKTAEEASLAARASLRTTDNIASAAETTAASDNAGAYIAQKFGVEDTKPAAADVVDTAPKGTTTPESATTDYVNSVDDSARQATASANAALAGERAVTDVADLPSLTQLLKDLPNESAGRTVVNRAGNTVNSIIKGDIDLATTARSDKAAILNFKTYINEQANKARAAGKEFTPAEREYLTRINNPRNDEFLQSEYYAKVKGAQRPGPATVEEWLPTVKTRGDFVPYPARFKKPEGATGLKVKDAREAIDNGTLHGKKLTATQRDAIVASVANKFAEAQRASRTVNMSEGAVAKRLRAFLNTEEKAANDIFGKDLAGRMRKMTNDTRLVYSANLVKGLADGSNSFDDALEYVTKLTKAGEAEINDVYSSTVQAFGRMVASATGRNEFLDIPAYVAMRRQAVSEINTARGAELAATLKNGRKVEEMLILSGATRDTAASVKKWLPDYFAERIQQSKLRIKTKRGVKRTSETMGKGRAYDVREFSTFEMWTLLMKASNFAIKDAKARGLYGKARADYVRMRSMSELAIVEKLFDDLGYPMWIGTPSNGRRFLISPSQAISAMYAANPRLTNILMFNGDTAGPFTYMMDAFVESMYLKEPLSSARLKEILTGKAAAKYYSKELGSTGKHVPEENGFISGGVYGKEKVTGDDLLKMFEADMPKMLKGISSIVSENSKSFTSRFGKEAGDLSMKYVDDMEALAADSTRLGSQIEYIASLEDGFAEQALAKGAMDLSAMRAIETAWGVTPTVARTMSKSMAKGTSKAKSAGKVTFKDTASKSQKAAAGAKADEAAKEAAAPALKEGLDSVDEAYDTFKLSDYDPELKGASPEALQAAEDYARIELKSAAIKNPLDNVFGALGSRFSRHYDMPNLSNMVHSIGGITVKIRESYLHNLNLVTEAASKHGALFPGTKTPLITKVFQDVQNGVPTQGYEDVYEMLRKVSGEVFDIESNETLLSNPFFRSQQGVKTIDKFLDRAGITEGLRPDMNLAVTNAKNNGTDLWTEYSKLWRTIPIEDPIDSLARYHQALMRMNMHVALAHDFERMARANGFISDVPKPGWVKASDVTGDFFEFLPKDVYFDSVIMKELQHFSDIAEASRSLGGPLGEFVNKYVVPVQNTWKYAITLPRPGHHTRNAIGDATLTYMAEGFRFANRSANDAFRILAVKNNYTDVDLFKALNDRGVTKVPNGTDVLVTAKGVPITVDSAYDALVKQGLVPTHHAIEGLMDDAVQASSVSRILDKAFLRGGKTEKFLGGISEARDHWARTQHFMQIVRKHANDRQFKDIDELFEYAAKRVKKYHPDSSMLTAFEAKYMRNLIPFYSWFRGALPAVLESTFMYPGRFMMVPKASYNLAYAMGLNPDAIYDPFPQDQMFPSFLTNKALGPQFQIGNNFFGMNPGIASLDVLNQIGTDPLRGVAGMTSPLFRVPLELMSGGAWGTGARIKDQSDYVDASIPGLNYLANMTGISPTGSVASIFQGKGLDQQYQVAAGNKTPADQATSFLNWMTGLGFQNMSKSNYINYAEIEKRNAAAKDQRSAY